MDKSRKLEAKPHNGAFHQQEISIEGICRMGQYPTIAKM